MAENYLKIYYTFIVCSYNYMIHNNYIMIIMSMKSYKFYTIISNFDRQSYTILSVIIW